MNAANAANAAIERSFVPKLAKKARLRFDRHSGGHMIIYPERGLALNESAAEIAKRLDGVRSIEAIAHDIAMSTEGEGDEESIVRDVIAFIEQLAAKGLLER
jgi:coenzyme PQQ biosynthesis protein PqqD